VDSDLDLLRGTRDVLVLKSLIFGARHGYDVARWIFETSRETLRVDEGALYTALHRLENRGWLESEWGMSENNRRARYYRLTAAGRRALGVEVESWKRFATGLDAALRST
jgi:transcriptional regulator